MEIVIILALILIIIIFGLIVDRYGKQKRLINKEILTLHLEVEDMGNDKILVGRLDDLDVTDIVEDEKRLLHFTVHITKWDKTVQISEFVDMNRAIYKGEMVRILLVKKDNCWVTVVFLAYNVK